MDYSVLKASFQYGEISPFFGGQVQSEIYAAGVREMKNVLPDQAGGFRKRNGTIRLQLSLNVSDYFNLVICIRRTGYGPIELNFNVLVRRPDDFAHNGNCSIIRISGHQFFIIRIEQIADIISVDRWQHG